ncbi:MAG: metallophosphoesterase [Burkholderiales bacterium]
MKRLIVFAAAASLAACLSIVPSSNNRETFSFAVIGDLGYTVAQEPMVENLLADLNEATNLSFVVHVGDLGSPFVGSCTNEFQVRRLSQFQASVNPLIYTPGDNDWTDCHEKNAGAFDPLERLANVRKLFFPNDESLGKRRMALTRQSANPTRAAYRENTRWSQGGITFITLHVVGSNNGWGISPAVDAEFRERSNANLEWMREGFAHARANESRGVMILQQGNIFPGITPYPAPPNAPTNGFDDIRAALEQETIRYGKPVMLVHGDSHFFRVDKPLGVRAAKAPGAAKAVIQPSIENFTRVEGFGQPNHHWLRITVDDSEGVFTVRQRIVPTNIQKR